MLIGLLGHSALIAQFSDNNTEAINQYFQVNVNEPTQAKLASQKTDANIGSFVEIVQTGKQNNININSLQSGDEQIVSQTGQQNGQQAH